MGPGFGGQGEDVKHVRYFWYVTKHRWFVFVACWQLGIPWLGLIHDWSKFTREEWGPYAEYFYGKNGRSNRSVSKDRHPGDRDPAFDEAWRQHYTRNKHHPQFWLSGVDPDGGVPTPMPEKYVREMVADWTGAGRAIQGRKDWRPWYLYNRDRLNLHPDTKALVESWL